MVHLLAVLQRFSVVSQEQLSALLLCQCIFFLSRDGLQLCQAEQSRLCRMGRHTQEQHSASDQFSKQKIHVSFQGHISPHYVEYLSIFPLEYIAYSPMVEAHKGDCDEISKISAGLLYQPAACSASAMLSVRYAVAYVCGFCTFYRHTFLIC